MDIFGQCSGVSARGGTTIDPCPALFARLAPKTIRGRSRVQSITGMIAVNGMPSCMKHRGLAVNKDFTTSFFDVDGFMGFHGPS